MNVITTINGIPLFINSSVASVWGKQFGLNGFHTHMFKGRVGYMSGPDHATTVAAVAGGVINPIPTPTITPTPTPTITPTVGEDGGEGY